MNKPNNYDNLTVGGFTPIELGGHRCIIKKVEELKNRNNDPMICVFLDTDITDAQPGYFSKQFVDDIRPDKKWPKSGRKYIMVKDRNGNCNRSFKTFTTAFADSNNCEIIWGDSFCGQFSGKKIGAVFGEEESEYNGKTTMRREVFWFCDIAKVDDERVPAARYLNNRAAAAASGSEVFAPTEDEDLPFN